jgi:protein TonB
MFQSSFVDSEHSGRRPWSFTASFIFQCGLVAVALVIPLLNTAELPAALWVSQILAPAPPPAAAPPRPPADTAPRPTPVRQFDGVLRQPPAIPEKVAVIEETEVGEWAPPQIGVPGGVPCPGCMPTGVIGSITGSGPAVPPPPPPVVEKPKAVVPETPIQVVSELQAAKLIHKVTPVYPAMARNVRVSGVVEIEAIIAKDGSMRSLRVLTGHPLLINAAVDAVKQWRYRPTLLQGQPVEVITRIQVNFTLR